jgi:aryl-alcohol dehydrogenase-like predicted oxidoreductase
MHYRDFGKTGLKVSEVGLGCGPLGSDPNADYLPLLERALALGVSFYDTADFYGDFRSEEWLGKAFAKRRDQVIIATKFGTVRTAEGRGKDWSVAHMRRALEDSLRRLQTDYVDIYQLHSPPPSVLGDTDLLEALRELKQEGKIRFFGISLDGGQYCIDAVEKWQPDAIQILFNMFNFEPAYCFRACKEAGVGLIIKAPLDSGMLGGDLMAGQPMKGDDPRERWSAEQTARRQKLMEGLEFLTDGTGRTWSQAALQFVLCYKPVSTVIPGTTSVAHLEENAAAAGGKLTHEELRRLHGLMGGEFAELNLGW